MDITLFKNILLLLIIVIANIIDWRTTKIPNLLTFPAAACGIILNYISGGGDGALMACAGWFLAALIVVFLGNMPMGPGGASGGIGMGDAKLLAAVGAFLGPKSVLIVILYFCIFFGLMSCMALASKVSWNQVGAFVAKAIFDGDTTGMSIDTSKLTKQRKAPIPISLAILAGTVITMCFEKQTMAFFGVQ